MTSHPSGVQVGRDGDHVPTYIRCWRLADGGWVEDLTESWWRFPTRCLLPG
jgi:hypothetical protein